MVQNQAKNLRDLRNEVADMVASVAMRGVGSAIGSANLMSQNLMSQSRGPRGQAKEVGKDVFPGVQNGVEHYAESIPAMQPQDDIKRMVGRSLDHQGGDPQGPLSGLARGASNLRRTRFPWNSWN